MKIDLHVRRPLRRWHIRLADALFSAGHTPRYVVGSKRRTGSVWTKMAIAAEKRLFGPSPSLADSIQPPRHRTFDGSPDLAIVLDGETPRSGNTLTMLVAEAVGESALVAAIAQGGTPIVRIAARIADREYDLVHALLAVEHQTTLSRALDQVLARLVSLVLQGVQRTQRGFFSVEHELSPPNESRSRSPLGFMVRGLAAKMRKRLPGGTRDPNHWRIGFRKTDGLGTDDQEPLPDRDVKLLPDDGRRFYADPMPFDHEGRTHLFFEAYPYTSGKGVIGAIEIGPSGSMSMPRTVLEQPFHLSYPMIVQHCGQIYMMPEMSAARRVQLFRADSFPDRWVTDRVLLDGIAAADATPVFHDGLWWLFAALSDDGGSSWDQLGLFHAHDFFGPWVAHQGNPVLVDAGAARPAGAMWHQAGSLMRVAQDCRAGYGVGLAICRVDRLDTEVYQQTVVRRLGPPGGYGADGIHTLNRTASLEVFDLRYPSPEQVRSDADRIALRVTGRG